MPLKLPGIGQIRMRYGTIHRTDFNWFSKGKVHFLNKVYFPF